MIIALKQKEVLENDLLAKKLEIQLRKIEKEYKDKISKEKDVGVLVDMQNAAIKMIHIVDAIVGGK